MLDAIREVDRLILGTPNYLGDVSAVFRALYERLVFQNLTYNRETPCCNPNPIPVLLIMTSNAPEGYYRERLDKYRQTLNGFVGPTEVFVCGDTLQLKDYSKTDCLEKMFGEFADCTNSPNISLLYELWFAGRAQGPPLRYNQGFRTCFAFCNAPLFASGNIFSILRETACSCKMKP